MSFEALAGARKQIVDRSRAELTNLQADITVKARILEDMRVREATLVSEIMALETFQIPVPRKAR